MDRSMLDYRRSNLKEGSDKTRITHFYGTSGQTEYIENSKSCHARLHETESYLTEPFLGLDAYVPLGVNCKHISLINQNKSDLNTENDE